VHGKPEWEYKICKYFSTLDMVAITIEYRLANRFLGITPVECIKDAKSAIRWVRKHSTELSIDPNKIVAAGFSAGGHLAACTAILEGFNEKNEEQNISSIPNALILWSACVNPVEKDSWFEKILKNQATMEECSPFHNIRSNLPPTILFHGDLDGTVPILTVKEFTEKMKKFGNRCELNIYQGQVHRPWGKNWKDVYNKMENFIKSLGFISKRKNI
ncbi:MAG: alpha/beta hydrolase, partial [bacterium]